MADTDLTIRMRAKNEASAEMAKLKQELGGVQTGVGDLASGFGALSSILTTGAIVGGIGAITKELWSLGVAGAQLDRLKVSHEQLAVSLGSNSDAIIASLRKASGETVATADLVLASNRAMMLGLGADAEQLGQLMEVARFRGRAMGIDATQAFSDIVTGIGRMSPMILDNLGIVLDAETTFGKYAASIGKTSDELSKMEKQQALLTATLETGLAQIEAVGGMADDTADKIDQATVKMEELKDAWALRLAPTVGTVSGFLVKAMNEYSAAVETAKARTMDLNQQIQWWRDLLISVGLVSISTWKTPMAGGIPEAMQPFGWTPTAAPTPPLQLWQQTGVSEADWVRHLKAMDYSTNEIAVAAKLWQLQPALFQDMIGATSLGWETAADILAKIESNTGDMAGDLKGLMAGTRVTELDVLETKMGVYKEKWDEPMRRVADVLAKGEKSPWAAQYFPGETGDMLRMRALQFQKKWGMGQYGEVPLLPGDIELMKGGLVTAALEKQLGEQEQTALANSIAAQYGPVFERAMKGIYPAKMLAMRFGQDAAANDLLFDKSGTAVWDKVLGAEPSVNVVNLWVDRLIGPILGEIDKRGLLTGQPPHGGSGGA